MLCVSGDLFECGGSDKKIWWKDAASYTRTEVVALDRHSSEQEVITEQALEPEGSDYWINTVQESDDWMFQWDDGQLQQTKGSNKVSVLYSQLSIGSIRSNHCKCMLLTIWL